MSLFIICSYYYVHMILIPFLIFHLFCIFRIGLRSCFLLLPMLGVTWILGPLGNLHKTVGYVFDLLSSIQVSYLFFAYWSAYNPILNSYDRSQNCFCHGCIHKKSLFLMSSCFSHVYFKMCKSVIKTV